MGRDESTTTAAAHDAASRPTTSESAVVFAGDDGVGPALAVAMRSALKNLPAYPTVDIYVIDNGLSASTRRRLVNVVKATGRAGELRWIQPSLGRLRELATNHRISSATYCKLLIPELLPPYIRRVLYLDADVLVLGDLTPLFALDLGTAPVGAVPDFLDRPEPYFNAGVLLMDMESWRTNSLGERALEYAATRDLHDLEQDALNAVVDTWYELDARWNVQHGNLFFYAPMERPPPTAYTEQLYRRRWDLYRDAAILHFVGGAKPWVHWCSVPGTLTWVQTLVRTKWFTNNEAMAWVLRWGANRARFRIGMARRRMWAGLGSRLA